MSILLGYYRVIEAVGFGAWTDEAGWAGYPWPLCVSEYCSAVA